MLQAPTNPTRRRSNVWAALSLAPLATAAAWVVYSTWGIDHDGALPPALPGETFGIETRAGRVTLYADGPREGAPLILVHSINAAASSYEVRPLYLRYRGTRPVYAIDLPGFGLSERRRQVYTPRLMVDALHDAIEAIRARHPGAPADAMGLSLSCEYLARAAIERPGSLRSLGLISPTGFDSSLAGEGRAQSDRGNRFALEAVSVPLWSQAVFDLVVSRPSMRYFLQKTWGSKAIDEGLLDYGYAAAHQPGATHAVWSFLTGYLFADDVTRIYRLLELPIWTVHGVRGDFVDYRYERQVEDRPNWTLTVLETGAFPHFEQLDRLSRSYDAFFASSVIGGRPYGEPFASDYAVLSGHVQRSTTTQVAQAGFRAVQI